MSYSNTSFVNFNCIAVGGKVPGKLDFILKALKQQMGLGFVCWAQSIPENWIKRWNWKSFIALGINQESE